MEERMFEPCVDFCYNRFGRQYSESCDDSCYYANIVKVSRTKNQIIDYLLDMLEEEHMDMKAVAVKKIEKIFNTDEYGIPIEKE